MNRLTYAVSGLVIVLLLTALAGCVSTKERYERVQAYRSDGKLVAAAYEMVEVLESDPQWPDGRRELNDLARAAIDQLMTDARAAVTQESPVAAVDAMDEIEALRRACQRVDVSVLPPAGYASLRARAETNAYRMLVDRAEGASAREDWAAADAAYIEAAAYVDDETTLAMLDTRRAGVLQSWAEADMEREAYRTAFDRAETALSLSAADTPRTADLRALQDAAVTRGTRVVAFLPVWQTESAESAVPPGFLRELDDVLSLEHWAEPPLFVATAPQVPTRRVLRRFELDRRLLSRTEAARIGRALETDLVITADLIAFQEDADDIERETGVAPWVPETTSRSATSGRERSGPVDTTFVIETYDRELTATVEVRLIDPRGRRTLSTERITAEVDGPMERGVFEGNWRNLDLSGAERSLFHPEDLRQRERELELLLVDALAASVADDTFRRIIAGIE